MSPWRSHGKFRPQVIDYVGAQNLEPSSPGVFAMDIRIGLVEQE
jgi:hypothetical protein